MKRTCKSFLPAGALCAAVASCASTPGLGTADAAGPGAQAADARSMKTEQRITILYDAFGRDPSVKKDWGFSALIEVGGKRVLFDTGNNAEILAHNAAAVDADLTDLDFVIMSHRHGDHMGGLSHVLRVNPDVVIYAPKENFGVYGSAFPGTFYRRNESLPRDMRYFDGDPPETLHFGTPWPQGEFRWISETMEIAPNFRLILLKGHWGVDLDVMELSLAIDTPQGVLLVVGCSHPTIESIVSAATAATGKPIYLVIGGLHLLPANDEDARRIATSLRDSWNVEWIAPDHCTGEPAFEILRDAFADRYLYAGVGTTIDLDGLDARTLIERGKAKAAAGSPR